MRLQLDCFRRALWPYGEDVGEDTQSSLMARIHSGELVDLEVDPEAGGLNAPGVASLTALAATPRLLGGSTESGSSVSGSHSWSSWGSLAGVQPGEPGKAGLAELAELAELGALAARLNPNCHPDVGPSVV